VSGGFRRLMRGETNIDFVGRARTWAIVSAAVIGISLIGIFGRGLNFSLEFEGGSSLTVPIANEAGVSELNDALAEAGVEGAVQVVTSSEGRAGLVRTEVTDEEKLTTLERALAEAAGQLRDGSPDVNAVSRTTIGPSWGEQITSKMVRGLIVFLVLVALYISVRFEPKMAVGALAALIHDLVATAGIYALVGFEVSPATVIALLTLMGYSLYDTVVVYDRVKENTVTLTAGSRTTYSAMVNRSLNEVLMRSINTSVSTVLPIAGLLFVGVFLFGAVTLKDLALAMFIGSIVGTYSSIFVATPLLAVLKEREPQNRALARRAAGERVPARAGAPAGDRARTDRSAPTPGGARTDRGAPEPSTATDPTLDEAVTEGTSSEATTSPPRPAKPMPARPARPPRARRGKRRGKRR